MIADRTARHAEKLRFLLDYGMLAPARGRPQPWSVYANGDAIELWLEHSCTLPILDPLHREVVVGCGVALAQLQMALRRLGAREHVQPLPDPSRPALLARVRVLDFGRSSPDSYALFLALAQAHEAREAPARDAIARATLDELTTLASDERAALRWVDATSFASSAVDTPSVELGGSCGADGIASIVPSLHPFRQRSFHPSTREWVEESDFSLRAAVVCVLATAGDTAVDWLNAGRALGRVLVRARVDGLHPSFRDATHELDRMRTRMRSAQRALAVPQVLFRLGYPEKTEVMRVEIPRYSAQHA